MLIFLVVASFYPNSLLKIQQSFTAHPLVFLGWFFFYLVTLPILLFGSSHFSALLPRPRFIPGLHLNNISRPDLSWCRSHVTPKYCNWPWLYWSLLRRPALQLPASEPADESLQDPSLSTSLFREKGNVLHFYLPDFVCVYLQSGRLTSFTTLI